MTNRERVIAALEFQRPDYVPYGVLFTQQMLDKMIAHTGRKDYLETLNHHIHTVDMLKPQVEIEPEYFQDEFGVVWNKTGVDKDIGVVERYLLEDEDDLEGFELPPVDEDFIRSQMESLMAMDGDCFRMAMFGFSLFERAWTLRGMENLLCDMIVDPDFVHCLFDKIVNRMMKILDIVLEYAYSEHLFPCDAVHGAQGDGEAG